MATNQALDELNAAISILRDVRKDVEGDVGPRRFFEKLDGVVSGIKSAIGDLET